MDNTSIQAVDAKLAVQPVLLANQLLNVLPVPMQDILLILKEFALQFVAMA